MVTLAEKVLAAIITGFTFLFATLNLSGCIISLNQQRRETVFSGSLSVPAIAAVDVSSHDFIDSPPPPALPETKGWYECYLVYAHKHVRFMAVFKKPVVDWTIQDHQDEIVKRKLNTENDLVKSTNRWQKYINTKIGIGKEFQKTLDAETEQGSEDDDKGAMSRAIKRFEDKWASVPHSNVSKLWRAIEDERKAAEGLAKSTAGRKKRKIEECLDKVSLKKRPGRPVTQQ